MRVFAQCAAVGTLAAIVCVSGTVTGQTKDPAPVLAAARQALGGEKKLSAIKSFTATGRTRQVRGDNLVPIEFEIFVELPDKYLRKDEIPAQESAPTASGFNGEEWLQDPPPPPAPPAVLPAAAPGAAAAQPGAAGAPGRGPAGPAGQNPAGPTGPSGPPRNPAAVRVATLKQDFTRLTLGMFASSFAAYPLTFTYVGEAEAPQGKADVLEAKGPNNFTIRFFVNKETHLPIMVSWVPPVAPARPPMGPGAGRGTGAPSAATPGERGAPPATPPAAAPVAGRGAPPAGERGAPAGQAAPGPAGARPAPSAPVENRLYFADYRDVDGVQFPFRLRRAVGADTIEETTFDRFKVNAKIDPKKFEVRKPQ
ncbi:MAG TPA: hypothetical protein VF921_20375 [Vicinamibacterales bacterium]